MKKILLAVLTAVLAVSVLSGCNDSSEKTSATQDSTKSSSASEANPTQKATRGEFYVLPPMQISRTQTILLWSV